MTRNEILKGIQHVFDEYLEIDTIVESEMDIIQDLQLESLELGTFVIELENHFKVMLDEGDEQEVKTIADLVYLIEKSLNEQQVDKNE
ncbi:MAG: acyl carrier protein [Desulfobacteraceae bacterium]|nr:acyl carrier protein [Desulfobacteraceae bacterium]